MQRIWNESLFRRTLPEKINLGDLVFLRHYGFVGKMAGPYRIHLREGNLLAVSIVGMENSGLFQTNSTVFVPRYRK